jgi:hypothetical protein
VRRGGQGRRPHHLSQFHIQRSQTIRGQKWSAQTPSTSFPSYHATIRAPTGAASHDVTREPLGLPSGGRTGLRPIGLITRKYPQRNMAHASSLAREAYCFAEAVTAFMPFLYNSKFVYITDSQALARLWTADRISHVPFIARQLHRVTSTISRTNCRLEWRPRTDPLLRNVDALGR